MGRGSFPFLLLPPALCLTGCPVDDRTLVRAEALATDGGADARDASGEEGGADATDGRAPDLDARTDAEPPPPDGPLSFDAGPCVHRGADDELDCEDTLVLNADFNVNTAGWKPDVFATVRWDPRDSQAESGSGSLRVKSVRKGAFEGTVVQGASQCVEVEPGSLHSFLAETLVPAGQGSGSAEIGVWFFQQPGCQGQVDQAYTVAGASHVDTWGITTGTSLITPQGMRSMLVRLNVKKDWRADSFEVLFDAVRVRAR